jgi:hypothetical protein
VQLVFFYWKQLLFFSQISDFCHSVSGIKVLLKLRLSTWDHVCCSLSSPDIHYTMFFVTALPTKKYWPIWKCKVILAGLTTLLVLLCNPPQPNCSVYSVVFLLCILKVPSSSVWPPTGESLDSRHNHSATVSQLLIPSNLLCRDTPIIDCVISGDSDSVNKFNKEICNEGLSNDCNVSQLKE